MAGPLKQVVVTSVGIGAAKAWRWSRRHRENEHGITRDKRPPVVVVTGIGVVTSLGAGKDENWKKLTAGQSGIRSHHALSDRRA